MKCSPYNPLNSAQQGFTLVELVVVILILGIISINVGSRFLSGSAFADRQVADELIEAIRYAQHVAMSRGGNSADIIRIVTTSTSYTVEQTNGAVTTVLPNPNRSGDYSGNIPSNSSLSATTISFNGLGQPTPNADSTITVGNPIAFTITVEGETGYAHY